MPYSDPIKQKEAQRQHYLANKADYSKRSVEGRQRRRAHVAKLKEKPCMDCGVQYPWYVMEFDHRPGTGKIDKVSDMIARYAWGVVLTEIEKCDVVCANCHHSRTWNRAHADVA